MARVLMIVAPRQFRDEELFVTKDELEKAGHTITLCSTIAGRIAGSRGGNATATEVIENVDCSNYDAVVFVGGGGAKVYFDHPEAIRIAQEMERKGAIVSAICIGPVILANAGLLKGKNATVFETETGTIEAKGAKCTGTGVTVDGRIVTANGPAEASRFAIRIIALLEESQSKKKSMLQGSDSKN